jgi:hypothetical protein
MLGVQQSRNSLPEKYLLGTVTVGPPLNLSASRSVLDASESDPLKTEPTV